MRSLLLLIAAVLVGGCNSEAAKPRANRQQRIEAAEIQVAKAPVPRTYRYPDAELRVLQVPVADAFGFIERQQCYVWRDLEFRTTSISCSAPPEMAPPANQP